MRRFTKDILKFSLPALLLFAGVEFFAGRWYGKYLGMPGQYHLFEAKRKEVRNLFVGDSHIFCAVDTTQIDSAYVLWWGARDLYYSKALIEQNISQMPSLRNVVLNLSFFSFANVNAIQDPSTINDYYHLGIIPDVKFDPRNLSTLYSRNEQLYETFRRVLQKRMGIPYTEPAPSGMDNIHQLDSDSSFIIHAKAKVEEHTKPVLYADKHKEVITKNIGYLEQIISDCESHNINFSIVIPPLTKYYRDDFQYRSQFDSALNIVKMAAPGLKVYDHSALYSDSLDHFRDADHLNSKGAAEYTSAYILGMLK